MAEGPPKHPKRYGHQRRPAVRDYEASTYRPALQTDHGIAPKSKRPQRPTIAAPVVSDGVAMSSTNPRDATLTRQPALPTDQGAADDVDEDPLVAETAFPTQREVYTCKECNTDNLSMIELSAHYNLNEVQLNACQQLALNTQQFASLLEQDFQLDLVDEKLQQQALEYIGDLLGIEPLQRTAMCMCDLATKALHIDEAVYNEFPSGLPSVPTADFKRFPGCHESVTVRDHELVFCSEEVARLGPMSNISSLVHLSTTLAKMAIQDALAEVGKVQNEAGAGDQARRVYPSALALPEYFKLFW